MGKREEEEKWEEEEEWGEINQFKSLVGSCQENLVVGA